MAETAKKPFLSEIQIAQGIGITLVVAGHLLANANQGPVWYADLKRLIYQFHMPFFMYLSGFTFMWVRAGKAGQSTLSYVQGRMVRLIVPFFMFGILIVVAKQIALTYVTVANPPDSWLDGFTTLFINTESSPARSIWYIFALFVMSVATFALGLLNRTGLLILLGVSVVMHLTDVPDILYLNRVFYFYLFFVVGMIAAENYDRLKGFLQQTGIYWLALFTAVLLGLWMWGRITDQSKLLGGLCALPALHYAALKAYGAGARLFTALGALSFPIYLMNTLAIGAFNAAYVIVFSDVNNMFLVYLAGAMVVGTLLPIAALFVTRRVFPPLAKLIS
ncbi:MAG: acyltransferase family protein [Pseudomonadota bacterium]